MLVVGPTATVFLIDDLCWIDTFCRGSKHAVFPPSGSEWHLSTSRPLGFRHRIQQRETDTVVPRLIKEEGKKRKKREMKDLCSVSMMFDLLHMALI